MVKLQDLELNVHTSVGVVRPGDKLVIATSARWTDQELHDHVAQLEEKLPGVEIVVIRAEALVVYRR